MRLESRRKSEETRARCKFQRALRSKKEGARSRRGPANCHEEGHNKWLLILWIIQMIPKHGKWFSLLLCHYALLVFLVVFFFLLHHRLSSFWANRDFSCQCCERLITGWITVAKEFRGCLLVLRENDDRVCFRVELWYRDCLLQFWFELVVVLVCCT